MVERRCVVCGRILVGRQRKWCCNKCRNKDQKPVKWSENHPLFVKGMNIAKKILELYNIPNFSNKWSEASIRRTFAYMLHDELGFRTILIGQIMGKNHATVSYYLKDVTNGEKMLAKFWAKSVYIKKNYENRYGGDNLIA